MTLKSLELNGFKSFASKTVLEFPFGITAIVGPNGSGKSNLIDAIRWLLGEREAKNLRSAKAEDLIFGGTPKKPRLAAAQVGLSFDNNSGLFPIDFKEILIVRRVGRDGASQYFLNKSEVRLKDIIDFFSRSRLGTKGLTIINQGESDLFIKASPEERRVMIEEILGLREYQIKKTEAARKLRNSSFNLEKIRAMIGEITPRLKMLKRQTNKWAKRIELQKELEELETNYFSYKLREIKSGQTEVESVLHSLKTQINKKQNELKMAEAELKKIESQPKEYQETKKIKQQQNELLSQRSQIQKELGRLEVKLEFLNAKSVGDSKVFKNEELLKLINEIKTTLENNLAQLSFEQLQKTIKDLIIKIDEFLSCNQASASTNIKNDLSDLEKVKNELIMKLDNIEKEFEELERQEMKITSALEEFNKQFQKAFELANIKRDELMKLEEKRNRMLLEREKLSLRFQDLENQCQQTGRSIKEFLISNVQFPISEIDLPDIERRMFKLRAELAVIGEIDESLIKEAKEVEARYNFLVNQSKDLEKAIVDLKNLIKELAEKIHFEFNNSLRLINEEFNKFFRLMFGGGFAKLKIKNQKLNIKNNDNNDDESNVNKNLTDENQSAEESEIKSGVEISLNLPKKRLTSLEMLSGGEKSLVSIAALFALISISPPPFLVLDEIDAALDENNSKKFANLIKELSKKTQFIVVTHNRAVMEVADVLYGLTIAEEGVSKILSLKLET